MSFYELDSRNTNSGRIKAERAKARELRKTQWWKSRLATGICEYCGGKFEAQELTMDHRVPLARGGKSTKGNLVSSCKKCNSDKSLATPVEILLEKLNS